MEPHAVVAVVAAARKYLLSAAAMLTQLELALHSLSVY